MIYLLCILSALNVGELLLVAKLFEKICILEYRIKDLREAK